MYNDKLKNAIRDRISAGLKQRTLTTCSRWAQSSVIMGEPFPGPYGYEHHPWLKEIENSDAPSNSALKGAQLGFSVAMLNRSLFNIDVKRQSVLYLLPSKTPDATDFSATRFDPALELSPYLSKLFSDVKNVATKRAGSASLYIRGANSRSGLKSIPVSNIVFDEFDEMPEGNIPLAMERLSGQLQTQVWTISTPTIPNHGVDKRFQESTQEHFFFPCPGCSRWIELLEENLIVTGDSLDDPDLMLSHLICTQCKKILCQGQETDKPYLRVGQWASQMKTASTDHRGFYCNQLYSMAKAGQPVMLARAKIRAVTDRASEQEWNNSKMARAYLPDGAKINVKQIDECRVSQRKIDPYPTGRVVTMGVDQGKWLHCEIAYWSIDRMGPDLNAMATPLILDIKLQNFEDLDRLMHEHQIQHCVIDANPETRKAMEFAKRFHGYVKLCYYGKDRAAKTIERLAENSEYRIVVDRTCWMDMALGRFATKRIQLPMDLSDEYRVHLQVPARVLRNDKDGNPVATYINDGADHYAHARTYNEIALPLAASLVTGNQDIAAFL